MPSRACWRVDVPVYIVIRDSDPQLVRTLDYIQPSMKNTFMSSRMMASKIYVPIGGA